MKHPDGIVNFGNLLELIRVNQFLIELELTLIVIVGCFHEFLMQQTPMRMGVHHHVVALVV